MKDSIHSGHLMEDLTQIIDGTAIYTYIDPSNHPNVYIYIWHTWSVWVRFTVATVHACRSQRCSRSTDDCWWQTREVSTMSTDEENM